MGALGRFKETWAGLDTKGQVTLVGAALAAVVTVFALYTFASRPSYTTLTSGLDPARTGQAQKALDAAGVSYTIGNGGTELSVKAGQESQARIALAEKGVLNGSRVDFSIFDKQSLGATDFQQQVNYQRALEGQIATTIESIQGVSGAQVQLVLPQESLFAAEQQNATAAVLVAGGSSLDPSTIRGIAHLVSSSVKSLDTQKVTITDETGALLWPQASDGGGAANAATKLQADQLYAAQLSSQINALLTSTLGSGKAIARVHADLNVDKTSIEQVTYAKKGVPLTQQTDTERLQSRGGGAQLPAGTKANTPPSYVAGATTNGQSQYQHRTDSTTYGVDKRIERREVAAGAVRRLDVALVVDRSVPAAQVAQLRGSVASLAGVVRARGDTLAVSRITFAAQTPVTATTSSPLALLSDPMRLAKGALAALATLAFLFFMRRGLKRREGEPGVPEPTWLRELEGAVPLAALEAAPTMALPEAPQSETNGMQSELEEIARRSPESIALQVSQWMKE